MKYKITLSAYVETDLSIEEVRHRLDLGLLKYSIDDIIPEGDKQSISLEGYDLLDYEEFIVVPICEECLKELHDGKCYNNECSKFIPY